MSSHHDSFTPHPQATLRGHLQGVSALQYWNNTSQYLISGDYGGNLMLWNTECRVPCWTDEKTHENSAIMEIYTCPFSLESFYSHDKTGLVVQWKLVNGSLVEASQTKTSIPLEATRKFSVGYSGISRSSMFQNLLAVARSIPEDRLSIYDVSPTGSLEKPIMSFDYNQTVHSGLCTLVGFLNEQVVMTLHEDGSIKMWSLYRQEMIQHIKNATRSTLLSYGKYTQLSTWKVFVGGSNKTLVIFQFDGQLLKEESRVELKKNGLGDISIRNDQLILAVAHWDTKVRLYEIQNHFRQLVTLPHNQSVQRIQYAPQDSLLACGTLDGRVYLWNLYSNV